MREIERAGGGCEPPARAPGGRTARDLGRWPPLPINAPESSRAQRRPGVLGHPWVGSVTGEGIGFFDRLQLGVRVHGGQGQSQLRASAATRRAGSKTLPVRSM